MQAGGDSISAKLMNYKVLLAVGVGVVAIIGLLAMTGKTKADPSTSSGISASESQEIAGPIAVTQIDKSFSVPIRDSQGEEVSQLNFRIESAEKRNEILVKGQKAVAVDGREFLILNLKIDNSYQQGVDIHTADFFRLTVNGVTDEKYAPTIHSDAVNVPPISTKVSRVGFPINVDDENITLQVGDIESEKQTFSLDFN